MRTALHSSLGLHNQQKSHYHHRYLGLLWVIFLSVLIGFLTPTKSANAGYTPVYSHSAVLSAETQADKEVIENTGFLTQEIVARKVTATPTPTPQPASQHTGKESDSNSDSGEGKPGKSRQIGEYTWTIDVPDDDRAGTAGEILQALNTYRQKHGKGSLSWNDTLASFAQSRADKFSGEAKTDGHAGFMDYLNNQNGFSKLGFMRLGENSSLGYKVSATHLIEWVYAGDSPHDTNQLSGDWTSVGIGVNGVATDLIFAGNPL